MILQSRAFMKKECFQFNKRSQCHKQIIRQKALSRKAELICRIVFLCAQGTVFCICLYLAVFNVIGMILLSKMYYLSLMNGHLP